MINVAGQIFGKPDEAAAAAATVEQLMDDTAAEYPGLEGQTFALANYVPATRSTSSPTPRTARACSSKAPASRGLRGF